MKRHQEQAWMRFASEVGGEFTLRGFWLWRKPKVVAKMNQWTITLDIYTVSSGDAEGGDSATYTRIRAPYIDKDGFRFEIYCGMGRGLLYKLGKALGMQDIQVGYPEFDRHYIIKGNDESKVQALFANQRICQLIQSQPDISFKVGDPRRLFRRRLPRGVAELEYREDDVIRDVERLKSLCELFEKTLNQLCEIGSASEEEPGVVL